MNFRVLAWGIGIFLTVGSTSAMAEIWCEPDSDVYSTSGTTRSVIEDYRRYRYCKIAGTTKGYEESDIYHSKIETSLNGDWQKIEATSYIMCEWSGLVWTDVDNVTVSAENLKTGAKTVTMTHYCSNPCRWRTREDSYANRYCKGKNSVTNTAEYCHDVPGPCLSPRPTPTPSK